jgi:L-serine dehydratase
MAFSVFDVIGPSMIGPSSSHTAGAVRLGLVARSLCDAVPDTALVELHGSFAATGAGHATDRGVVAGLLGMATDDDRLKDSFDIAKAQGLAVEFAVIDLGEEAHPNTARITLTAGDRELVRIRGESVGGGSVRISEVDNFATNFTGENDLIAVWHADKPGFLSRATTLLSCVEANIATIHTARKARGTDALTLIEVDGAPPPEVLAVMRRIPMVTKVSLLGRLF